MKKFFSAVLAAMLVLSLSTFSLAAPADTFSTGGILGPKYFFSDFDYILKPKGGDSPEDDYYLVFEAGKTNPAEYGATVFLELVHAGESWNNFSLDMIRNMKVKAEWEQGGNLVESVSVSIVKSLSYTIGMGTDIVYYPALIIKIKDSEATADADIIGTVTLNKSKGDAQYRIKDAEIPIELSINHYNSYINNSETYIVDEDTQIVVPGETYLLKFDYDDEVEFSFGDAPNEGTFTVDVSGQGKLLMIYDTLPNAAVEAANPNANMVFFGFNNAKFNRTGEFFYETETGKYIYELVNGMPVPITSAEYDEADEGFRFYTRTLGRYVISDVELVSPDPEAAKAAVVSGTAMHNPTVIQRRYY